MQILMQVALVDINYTLGVLIKQIISSCSPENCDDVGCKKIKTWSPLHTLIIFVPLFSNQPFMCREVIGI